jgi:hypothetical protein
VRSKRTMKLQNLLDYLKRTKAHLPWIILLLIILSFEVRRKGFLIAYLDASGYITFGVSIIVSYFVCAYLLQLQESIILKNYKNEISRKVKKFVSMSDNSFARTLFAFVIFFSTHYLVLSINTTMLLNLTDQPYHVLFPCSDSVILTDEMRKEAMEFYGKKYFSDFECDNYSSSDDKW